MTVAPAPAGATTAQGTPFPGAAPTSSAPPAAVRSARVKITLGSAPKVSRKTNRLRVTLRCPSVNKATCRGTVVLRGKLTGTKRVATLGKRAFVIKAGRSVKLNVYVSKSARRVLQRKRKLRIGVSVSGRAGATRLTGSRVATIR